MKILRLTFPVVTTVTAGIAILAIFATATHAAVIVSADPDYPAVSPVFTLDPELYGVAERNVAADRNLRQTFQNPETFDVRQIVISLEVESGGVNGGLDVEIFEVDDTNAASWTPGNLVASFSIPTSETLPTSSVRLGFNLTGSDVFTLPQRDTGTQGYGIQVSNGDDSTNVGGFHHSNDGTDHYTAGIYYSEGGTPPNPARDLGVAMSPVPEPGTALLAVLASVALAWVAARRR